MKAQPLTSSTMLARGTAFANVVLPKGMGMSLQVDAIYPQLLVYDGPIPNDELFGAGGLLLDCEDDDLPDPMLLPDPLHANAFAHIHPTGRVA